MPGPGEAMINIVASACYGGRLDELQQEASRNTRCGLLMQLGKGELRGPIAGDEEVESARRAACS